MYKLKKALSMFVFTFSVILMLCLLSGTAAAVMSADNAEDRLGAYSSWAESISDGQIYCGCICGCDGSIYISCKKGM